MSEIPPHLQEKAKEIVPKLQEIVEIINNVEDEKDRASLTFATIMFVLTKTSVNQVLRFGLVEHAKIYMTLQDLGIIMAG